MSSVPKQIFLGFLVLTLTILFLGGCTTMGSRGRAGEVYVETFEFDSLDTYGDWNVHQRFGRVWRPHVATDWRPFFHGHWVWSSDGWLWMSYEPFGWITSHHGNWFYDPYLGWVWVPGYRWSPAVVVWMHFGDNLGWAPMPPPGIVLYDPWDRPPVIVWNFIHIQHFQREYIGRYVIRTPLPKPVPRTDIIKKAPELRVIEKITKTRITPVPVEKKNVEVEKKTYRRTHVPKREADKVKRHTQDVKKNALKPAPVVKKPPVKKPNSSEKQ